MKINEAISGFAVNDLEKARQFYSDVIGLKVTSDDMVLQLHTPGGAIILVYPKANHEPATFTILNLIVDDIKATMMQLKEKGIVFDPYDDGQHKTDEDGIFRGAPSLIAWFKDPFGNILSVIQA